MITPTKRTPLSTLFDAAKKAKTENLKHALFSEIIRQHGGLGARMYRRWAWLLEPWEITSYVWEALPTAVGTWDTSKGYKASTHLYYSVMCVIRQREKEASFFDGVRMPPAVIRRLKEEEKKDVLLTIRDARMRALDPDAGSDSVFQGAQDD